MAGEKHDKTEKPTAKRKKEARQDGNVPRSMDLGVWAAVMVGSFFVPTVFRQGSKNVQQLTAQVANAMSAPDAQKAAPLLGHGLEMAIITVAPLGVAMMVTGIVINVAQVGFLINRKALKPSFGKLNPKNGIKRILSPTGLINGMRNLVKILIVAGLAWQVFRSFAGTLTQPGILPLGAVCVLVFKRALTFVRTVASVGLGLAVADYAYQRRRINKQLMMTKQEIKEEAKQADGNPEIKQALKKRHMKMSRKRLLAEVAHADAIVVNPTHVAVAIKYDAGRGAPRVLAKGADEVATAIREEAVRLKIPMVEDIPLARTLWQLCEPGDEIPVDLYEAVARILAFLYRIKASGRRPLGDGPLKVPAPARSKL
jgi:flagellar biosynthetic protein FlhB